MVEKYDKKDPFKKREKEKYESPVPSREFISQYLEEVGCPTSFSQLLQAFGIESEDEKEGLRRRLKAMIRDGQLMSNRRGSFALVNQMSLIAGRILAHRDGFGFLEPDDGSSDIFLPAREMLQVFHDDKVLVRVVALDRRGRREGAIAEVLERNTHQVVGRYFEDGGIAYVDPDNKLITQDIIIPAEQRMGAVPGQFVVAEITAQPKGRRPPLGKIIEILGDQLTPGMEIELAIRSRDLPFQWPEVVIKEAQQFQGDTLVAADYEDRLDLRSLPFVTIDGEDAKDFDDAVYCQCLKNSNDKAQTTNATWRLFVAIADVAYYVQPGTELDQEAYRRGNSVYFPNKTIPMLPESLSNQLCSLMPNRDRLVMVCMIDLDEEGQVLTYQFDQAVIHSQARLTYNEVANFIAEQSTQIPQPLISPLKDLYQLYKKLYKQREKRGALDFDSIETRIIFDHSGKIDKIIPTNRNDAHRMIEEAMLLANVCTADFLLQSSIATLYRIHEGPEKQKLENLRDFLKAFSLRLTGKDKPTSQDYEKLLCRIKNRPDAHLLQTVLLRSLRQAVYSPKNSGHFGLAYEAYTHFTSPIRRYPDLLVHRAIKHLLTNKKADKFIYDAEAMQELGKYCSTTERRADLAVRNAVDWLKCDYMQDKIGQQFKGIISDVTGFGVFIQLENIYVEGLLHITSLRNDYYLFDPIHHMLRGRRSGQNYRLGDAIEVIVARVDINERKIDFALSDES